jgi:hypothetical protein
VWAGDGTAGTSGVSVDNVSIGSCPAECFGLAPATQFAFTDLIPGGDQGAIVMQQTNEPGQGYSASSFSTAMTAIVTHQQGLSATAPASVILAVPPIGSIASSSMSAFTAVQVALAQTLNVAFVNVQDRWGTAMPRPAACGISALRALGAILMTRGPEMSTRRYGRRSSIRCHLMAGGREFPLR